MRSTSAARAVAASDGSEFTIVAHRDIDYIAGDDYAENKDRLDVFMPEGATNAPVVVYFHGGALQNGTKAIGEGLARQLAARQICLSIFRCSECRSARAHIHIRSKTAVDHRCTWKEKLHHRNPKKRFRILLHEPSSECNGCHGPHQGKRSYDDCLPVLGKSERPL